MLIFTGSHTFIIGLVRAAVLCLLPLLVISPAALADLGKQQPAATKNHPHRIIVKPKAEIRKGAPAQLAALHARLGTRVLADFPALAGVQVVELSTRTKVAEVLQQFRDSKLYEYAEPDYEVHILATPNDPRYLDGSLWGVA